MQLLAGYIRSVSAINRWVGLTLSWLALAVVLVCFTVVVQRYFLHTTQLWMQDLYVWLSGAMFTGVAGFALLRDDHVRVDIFYRPLRRCAARPSPTSSASCCSCCPSSWSSPSTPCPSSSAPGASTRARPISAACRACSSSRASSWCSAVLVGLQGIAWACRSILVLAGREDLLPETLRYRAGERRSRH